MLETKLIKFLPEKISDETAYQLVNFMIDLAIALKNHYDTQLESYTKIPELIDF